MASFIIMVRSWWYIASVAMVKVATFRVRARLLLSNRCLRGMVMLLVFVMEIVLGLVVVLLNWCTVRYIKY